MAFMRTTWVFALVFGATAKVEAKGVEVQRGPSGVEGSVSNRSSGGKQPTASVRDSDSVEILLPNRSSEYERTASFENFGEELLHGSITFRLGFHSPTGEEAVEWTTSGIEIPAELIKRQCGVSELPQFMKLAYSVHNNWLFHLGNSATADGCGLLYTGGVWDPTAACSGESLNGACSKCHTSPGYQCNPRAFQPNPDGKGDHMYRWLNEQACSMGDLSGQVGELEVTLSEDPLTVTSVRVPDLEGASAGFAQMSTPFGVIGRDNVPSSGSGLICAASGPPANSGTNCKCLEYYGGPAPSIGTLTVTLPHETFYLAGLPDMNQLESKSIVVKCGSSFGTYAGRPLFCGRVS